MIGSRAGTSGINSSTEANFLGVLEKCGLKLDGTEGGLEIDCNPLIFQRKLQSQFRNHEDPPALVKSFMDGFAAVISDSNNALQRRGGSERSRGFLNDLSDEGGNGAGKLAALKVMLLPLVCSSGTGSTQSGNRSLNSYSLMRVLLGVEAIQTKLIGILIEKICECMFDYADKDLKLTDNMPRLILQQFRFMDEVVDPGALTTKLIDALETTSAVCSVQKEVIACIPEIIPDSGQRDIVLALMGQMNQNVELVAPVLDALSTIGIPADDQGEIVASVLAQLDRADLTNLPIVIRFLLQTATSKTIKTQIESLRENLQFESFANDGHQQGDNINGDSTHALIIDSLKTGIKSQKFVIEAWIKFISELEKKDNARMIDLIVLILLRSDHLWRKKIDALIRKKVDDRSFSPRLFRETIVGRVDGLRQYFGTLLSIAELLIRDGTDSQIECGRVLYSSLFAYFDVASRQNLVGSLMTHIGSGNVYEVDAALSILLILAETKPQELSVFNIFIKGLLDYLDDLSLSQIRTLFQVFATLSIQSPFTAQDIEAAITFESSLLSDLRLTIRKQLGTDKTELKQIAIIGSMALVSRYAACEAAFEATGAGK
ncbi:Fanconi anemia group D2 protein [Blyttiomyces sp. JEL0837]|nr:Fanconi anemia group D2 protein [Blyttiomyces sp. JEL0837]